MNDLMLSSKSIKLQNLVVSRDHTVGDPEFERRNQITIITRPPDLHFACRRRIDEIDPRMVGVYQQAIQGRSHRSLTLSAANCSVGKVSKQFLSEVSLCLPRTIQFNGAVFGEASDYIARASIDG